LVESGSERALDQTECDSCGQFFHFLRCMMNGLRRFREQNRTRRRHTVHPDPIVSVPIMAPEGEDDDESGIGTVPPIAPPIVAPR